MKKINQIWILGLLLMSLFFQTFAHAAFDETKELDAVREQYGRGFLEAVGYAPSMLYYSLEKLFQTKNNSVPKDRQKRSYSAAKCAESMQP